jgi:hypothetical protein
MRIHSLVLFLLLASFDAQAEQGQAAGEHITTATPLELPPETLRRFREQLKESPNGQAQGRYQVTKNPELRLLSQSARALADRILGHYCGSGCDEGTRVRIRIAVGSLPAGEQEKLAALTDRGLGRLVARLKETSPDSLDEYHAMIRRGVSPAEAPARAAGGTAERAETQRRPEP